MERLLFRRIHPANFGFTDPNDNPADAFAAVKITVLPAAGTLTDNGNPVSANQVISFADLIAIKVIFTPAGNLTGLFFLCKFQVEDDGGTASGGMNLDTTAKVLDIKLLKVNHAPAGTNGTVTAGINTTYVLKTADFGFTDPNDTPANSLLGVTFSLITTSAGTLTDNGRGIQFSAQPIHNPAAIGIRVCKFRFVLQGHLGLAECVKDFAPSLHVGTGQQVWIQLVDSKSALGLFGTITSQTALA